MTYSINEKTTIVAILIAIMEADGTIDSHEIDFLNDVITTFGLTESELEQMDDIDLNLVIDEFKLFSDEKKQEAKKLFIAMAKCDGYADPRELEIIKAVV